MVARRQRVTGWAAGSVAVRFRALVQVGEPVGDEYAGAPALCLMDLVAARSGVVGSAFVGEEGGGLFQQGAEFGDFSDLECEAWADAVWPVGGVGDHGLVHGGDRPPRPATMAARQRTGRVAGYCGWVVWSAGVPSGGDAVAVLGLGEPEGVAFGHDQVRMMESKPLTAHRHPTVRPPAVFGVRQQPRMGGALPATR